MPFKSQAQWKKCWAMKAKGQAGSWDCSEWAHSTRKKFKKLPGHKSDGKAQVKTAAELGRLAAELVVSRRRG